MLSKFLADVLPQEGLFCLWTKHNKQHIWWDTQGELAAAVEDFSNTGLQGVYFGTAAFSECQRKQEFVSAVRAFRLDIDAGMTKFAKQGDKVYETQRHAIIDLGRFIKATGLQPTYIVSSGEGLHVYYCLNDDLDVVTWTQTANNFKALTVQHGLKADPSVTADSARILRPPGTLHDNGKRVTVLKQTDAYHSPSAFADKVVSQLDHTAAFVAPVGAFSASAGKYKALPGINDDVLEVQGPPKSVKKIVPQCGAFRAAAQAKGNVEEPYWRAMLGIIKHTVEGAPVAHHLSKGYSGYDARETQAKFDNWNTGPTSCAEFSKYAANECAACPHAGKIRSPIQLGAMTTPEVEKLPEALQPKPPEPPKAVGAPWDNVIPAGFEVKTVEGKPTLIAMIKQAAENDDGDEVTMVVPIPFTTDIFWFRHWADAENSNDVAQVLMVKWNGKEQIAYTMEQTLIANQQKFREFLASKSIITFTNPKAVKAMEEYAKAQLARIKMLAKRPKVADHLGLRILPSGEMVCAHGKYMIYPDGHIIEGILGPALVSTAGNFDIPLPVTNTSEWQADVWEGHIMPRAHEYVEFLRKFYGVAGMEKFQLAIMMGLASPFMAFATGSFHKGVDLPANGLSVSLFETRGGRGKTTAVKAAVMAYGNPELLAPEMSRGASTDNARRQMLTYLGTMPSVMDELGRAGTSVVVDMISSVANGAPRARMRKDMTVDQGSRWSLINLITTNTSQRAMITAEPDESAAVQNRLLEINVENMPDFDSALREEFGLAYSKVSERCVGALGAVIHHAICVQGPENMNRLTMECVARASKLLDDQQARFQYRGLGAMIALHVMLSKLGLAPFDLQGLVNTFRDAFNLGKEYNLLNEQPTEGHILLSRMLMELRPHTVITQKETRIGRNSNDFDMMINGLRVPDQIYARHIVGTRLTYVSTQAVKDWCVKARVPEIEMLKKCKDQGVLTTWEERLPGEGGKWIDHYDLTKGMRETVAVRTRCYRVDTRVLSTLCGSLEDVTTASDNVVQMPQRETASESAATEGTGT